jgi:hypothetical protein
MISIEERIAEYCILPLPEKRKCEFDDCKTYLARSNSGNFCYRHEQLLEEKRLQMALGKKYKRMGAA